MWKLYLKSDEGIAVCTTFGRIKLAMANTTENVTAAEVQYIDYEVDGFDDGNMYLPIAHKRKSFKHEEEVRLVWSGLESGEVKPRSGTNIGFEWEGPPGRNIQVSLPDLVDDVLVAPSSQAWFFDLVSRVVKDRYKLPWKVIPNDFDSAPLY